MRLYELARVIRTKNAGPFTLTLDLFFADIADFKKVLDCPSFTNKTIAELYKTSSQQVRIHPFEEILAIKVSLPRSVSSGGPGDRDVYGAQQHFPLGNIEI
ncbi:MAG: hypothetical protein A2Y12_01050 [Planctomycetes bacterium GWF2_42_9]|nr:MAG: hypothetical protein A2Y12_01050 [Planctomycetes bacterium GWF2_42_9]